MKILFILVLFSLFTSLHLSDSIDLIDCNRLLTQGIVIILSEHKDTNEYVFNCSQIFTNFFYIQFDGTYTNIIKTTDVNLNLYPNIDTVYFIGFGGIDLADRFITPYSDKLTLYISYTKIEFFLNGKIVNKECDDYSIFKNILKLNNVNTIGFTNSNRFSIICPFIFSNSFIKLIYIQGITDTFINNNYLQFIHLKNITFDINSNVVGIELSFIYSFKIDSRFLNQLVYKNTKTLFIRDSNFMTFEDGLFTSLRQITRVLLRLNDLANFLKNLTNGNFLSHAFQIKIYHSKNY